MFTSRPLEIRNDPLALDLSSPEAAARSLLGKAHPGAQAFLELLRAAEAAREAYARGTKPREACDDARAAVETRLDELRAEASRRVFTGLCQERTRGPLWDPTNRGY